MYLLDEDSIALALPCMEKPNIFDSAETWDHLSAEEACLNCPVFEKCGQNVEVGPLGPRGFTGTWAARFYINGRQMSTVCVSCGKFENPTKRYRSCKCRKTTAA